MRIPFETAERQLTRAFGESWNPLFQLGALGFLFFWVLTVTGVYLFIFFDTSIEGAFSSVQYLSHEQWYLGGVMRSLHRYASAAMAVVVTLHLLREFSLGRFRAARWFSWVSGVPLLWLMFAAAIGGYWLVWDEFAQYIAIATSELLDGASSMGDPLARNFISNAVLSDRLFSLLVFLHIAIPLFMLLGMFVHVKRIKLPRTNSPRGLVWSTVLALVIVSLIRPATSSGPADLSRTVAEVELDWVYLNIYPLLDSLGPGAVWSILMGVSGLLILLPWLASLGGRRRPSLFRRAAGKARKSRARLLPTEPAVVDPDNCNGCTWCFQDCPYEAITMIPHESRPGHRQASVDPDLCTACGICAGACPSATPFRQSSELVSGIELPEFSIQDLRDVTEERLRALQGEQRIFVFGCDHGPAVEDLFAGNIQGISLPCIGMLPPSFADYVSRHESVDGVVIAGCGPQSCYFRLGSEWTLQRFAGTRMPHLRTTSAKDKVLLHCSGSASALREAVATLEARLMAVSNDEKAAHPEAVSATPTRGEGEVNE